MKKLFVIITILFCGIMVNAQETANSTKSGSQSVVVNNYNEASNYLQKCTVDKIHVYGLLAGGVASYAIGLSLWDNPAAGVFTCTGILLGVGAVAFEVKSMIDLSKVKKTLKNVSFTGNGVALRF
ncbi:MAG: hypothetical protein MJ198_07115 [Bacteroidales bacterium]|nr:hypothetical protein [Bacteroidales bacterium]